MPHLQLTSATGQVPVAVADEPAEPRQWFEDNRLAVADLLAGHGAVVVRGLVWADTATFGQLAETAFGPLMVEREGFAKRDDFGSGVYSGTEWTPDFPMCMHHELSYTAAPPRYLMFGCVQPPAKGGVTGLSDSRVILEQLPPTMVSEFTARGWQLTRNYNSETGVTWAEAFGLSSRAEVEAYCDRHGIAWQWRSGGGLRTTQRLTAIVEHPADGSARWFNQIAFLNKWTLDPLIRDFLIFEYGEDGLPFDTSFGDGTPISADIVETINAVYEANTLREPWQRGDLLLVDNVAMAHSREVFEGDRQIVVAMATPATLR
ncbi:TauD/TfdA family dioxygenase [Micromonospora sp. NPDC005220]|uniref:TauD/TfdA family dioxygenase n=1 Tax=Micromonospora sp. NPDC005220 TaxID=3155589 RepID=UPI0033A70CA7